MKPCSEYKFFFSLSLGFLSKAESTISKISGIFPSLAIYFYMCYGQVYILYLQVFKLSLLACGRLELAFLLMLLRYWQVPNVQSFAS